MAIRIECLGHAGGDESIDLLHSVRVTTLHDDATDVVDRLQHRGDIDERRVCEPTRFTFRERIAIEVRHQQAIVGA